MKHQPEIWDCIGSCHPIIIIESEDIPWIEFLEKRS
jgi:hypothetical protein